MIFLPLANDRYQSECGTWLLHMTAAGFGMGVVSITKRGCGNVIHREAGHDALSKAQAWCREQA